MSPDRSIRRFLSELRRRKVWHVAVTYVLVGAGVIGTGEAAIPEAVWSAIQLPAVVLVVLGLPIALVLAWAYEVRPEEPATVLEAASARAFPGVYDASSAWECHRRAPPPQCPSQPRDLRARRAPVSHLSGRTIERLRLLEQQRSCKCQARSC